MNLYLLMRKRLPKPKMPMSPHEQAKHEWVCGWWGGIVVGFVNGVAVCVMAASYLGKL